MVKARDVQMEGVESLAAVRATGNQFVDALPSPESQEVARFADLWTFAPGTRLIAAGGRIEHVYFPVSGAIAQLAERDGGRIEIASVGADGMSGVELALDADVASATWTAIVPLTALVLRRRDFLQLCNQSPQAAALARRYAALLMRLIGLSAACARHDGVEARLARWLLQLHDHAGAADLVVTHRLAAEMLDAERAAVTRAYANFVRHGAIRHQRGRLRIVDAAMLSSLACGCYAQIRAFTDEFYRAR